MAIYIYVYTCVYNHYKLYKYYIFLKYSLNMTISIVNTFFMALLKYVAKDASDCFCFQVCHKVKTISAQKALWKI